MSANGSDKDALPTHPSTVDPDLNQHTAPKPQSLKPTVAAAVCLPGSTASVPERASLPMGLLCNALRIICAEWKDRHPKADQHESEQRFRVTRALIRGLDHDIYSLLVAAGALIPDDDFNRAFRDAADGIPTPFKMAKMFGTVAAADNPLDPRICSSAMLAELEVRAKDTWPTNPNFVPINRRRYLAGIEWTELADWQQDNVRHMAKELEAKYRGQVEQGAPQKCDQNALLINLADIFLNATEQQIDRDELSHHQNSRFIQFAHTVLAPYFATTEVTPKALSRRWENLKARQTRRARPFRRQGPFLRRRPSRLK